MIRALIAACDLDGVIGVDGRIPWQCRGDLRLFRHLTMGCPVIMGRGTWESLPGPLDGRTSIVVSSTLPGAARSLSQAWGVAREECERSGATHAWVVGGASLYAAALFDVEYVYLTRVQTRVDLRGARDVARFPLEALDALALDEVAHAWPIPGAETLEWDSNPLPSPLPARNRRSPQPRRRWATRGDGDLGEGIAHWASGGGASRKRGNRSRVWYSDPA